MAASLQGFLDDLRAALRPAFCLHNFPSPEVEGHNKPVIEVAEPGSPLVLPPVTVQRGGAQEAALIEQSVNAARVSLRFRRGDEAEAYLLRTFLRFMVHRADQLEVVRRAALPGWDVSFLVTASHLERYGREALAAFICQFVADLYAELSAMKLGLRSRARAVVARYWQELEARRAAAPAPGGAAAAAAAGGT